MTRTKPLLAAPLAAPLVAPLVALCLAGPAWAHKKSLLDDPAYQVTYAPPVDQGGPANGSIFQPGSGYSPLFAGARAGQVGDVLTIQLVERTQASKSNSASTDRSGNIGLSPPTTGLFSKLLSATDIGASGDSGFKGKGDSAQSNALTGAISVTVAKVFSNGSMLVRGQKRLTLNRGDEYIQISGLVRPADVTADNVVLSTRVADARITYTGKGGIARASHQGWLSRFFSIISPF